MSKCRPKISALLESLASKGVHFEDITVMSSTRQEPTRELVIRVPYQALLSDPDVQRAFQDLLSISSID